MRPLKTSHSEGDLSCSPWKPYSNFSRMINQYARRLTEKINVTLWYREKPVYTTQIDMRAKGTSQ
jgi:hypothetical protein